MFTVTQVQRRTGHPQGAEHQNTTGINDAQLDDKFLFRMPVIGGDQSSNIFLAVRVIPAECEEKFVKMPDYSQGIFFKGF